MISTEDIREKILELAQDGKEKKAVRLTEVARELSSDNWRNSMVQIQLVADSLVKEGKIVSTQNGDSFEILMTRKSIL
jgi:Protein of unknown function (DUF3253)